MSRRGGTAAPTFSNLGKNVLKIDINLYSKDNPGDCPRE
jgi:hypothetical protein